MAQLFANSEAPDQTPRTALFTNFPYGGLQTKVGKMLAHRGN